MQWSAHRTTGRAPARAPTTIDHDIVACVMATLNTGEKSLVRDGERAFRSSIEMAETCRVTSVTFGGACSVTEPGPVDTRIAFALAGAERGVLATRAGWRLRLV
jgi:hypothetical protein